MENFIYARSFRDLLVYKQAFVVARRIFALSKGFPEDEKYALTSQIRRASRSIVQTLRRLGRNEGMNDILSVSSPKRTAITDHLPLVLC
jgi:23S rRNA-intervening sequence protein